MREEMSYKMRVFAGLGDAVMRNNIGQIDMSGTRNRGKGGCEG